MKLYEILENIKNTPSTNEKKNILEQHTSNMLLQKALSYGLNPFTPFNVIKVPKVTERVLCHDDENNRWEAFFEVADACHLREVTGKSAIAALYGILAAVPHDEEIWMRRILKKHLAIGASVKTVNKVFANLIPTFDISLAQKFEEKRIAGKSAVGVEPKLDGIRCFAIVEKGTSLLYARSGKLISNFDDTIGRELLLLGDGCYDGEIMGKDFITLMRQAYRKESIDVSDTYFAMFDFLPIHEWTARRSVMSCADRYATLDDKVQLHKPNERYVRLVPRHITSIDYQEIKGLHDEFVMSGMEGAMIKDLDAPYKFGRGYEVMKLKAFHDTDLKIEGLLEGTGKHSGKLGSVVVDYHGVKVNIGSGFSDELRKLVWEQPQNFVGRMIEVRYQEVTPDGSLRFPTFVCFRNDREEGLRE